MTSNLKRKLISTEVLESMLNESLTNVEQEIQNATPLLSMALELEGLELLSFGDGEVIFESYDGDLVHANYDLSNDNIKFENIQNFVVDEESERQRTKKIVSDLFESIIDDEKEKAQELLLNYFNSTPVRKTMLETKFVTTVSDGTGRRSPKRGKRRDGGHSAAIKGAKTRRKNDRKLGASGKKRRDVLRNKGNKKIGGKRRLYGKGKRTIGTSVRIIESFANKLDILSSNVDQYLDWKTISPFQENIEINEDENGSITSICVPTEQKRNEQKLEAIEKNQINETIASYREEGLSLFTNQEFCKQIEALREASVVDSEKYKDLVESIASDYNSLGFISKRELSKIISEALDFVGSRNFDDDVCNKLSDSISRKVFESRIDQTHKLSSLARVSFNRNSEDAYEIYSEGVKSLFKELDEQRFKEYQVFTDLYNAIRGIHESAERQGNKEVLSVAESHLYELASILKKESQLDFNIAEDAVDFINDIVETNLGTRSWEVSNSSHTTINGDHPITSKHASHGYSPKSDIDDSEVGDVAPVSDGKYKLGKGHADAEEMRNRSWANDFPQTYPSLGNPYMPDDLQPKMTAAKGVAQEANPVKDIEKGFGYLNNPTLPNSDDSIYQMKANVDKDLVTKK